MTTQVTQCPKCHTSFRVTEAQLNIANGAVRCGSCLHIFNAPDHWLDSSGSSKPAATRPAPVAPKSQTPAPDTDELLEEYDELLGDSDELPEDTDELLHDDDDSLEASLDIEEEDFQFGKSDALRSLDEEPEPAFNDTIEQRALDNIFADDLFKKQSLDLLDEDFTSNAEPEGDPPKRSALIGDSFDSPSVDEDDLVEDLSGKYALDDSDIDGYSRNRDHRDEDERERDDLDDLLISDDMDDDDADSKRFRDTRQMSVIESIGDDSLLDEEFGDRIEDGLEDDEEDDGKEEKTGDFSDVFLNMDDWEEDEEHVFKDLDDLGKDTTPADEDAWAKKLLEEDEEDSKPKRDTAPLKSAPPPIEKLTPEIDDTDDHDAYNEEPLDIPDQFEDFLNTEEDDYSDKLDPELMDILNERGQHLDDEPVVEDEFVLSDEPLMAGERIGAEKLALLANIEPEPVEIRFAKDRSHWARYGWMAGIVLAILAFGVQYVAFNFDRLARDSSYRGALTSACSMIGCTIPDRDDIRLIRSTNLMVRSHPQAADALVVDAIISNRADFKQRFPDMELQFTDLSGKIIASRRFKPEEYLSGELAGQTVMPIKQPIHISLEIVDPGKDAINYQLYLLPQQGS